MIFLTVGTTDFDALVRVMDSIAPKLDEEVVAQIGRGKYVPVNCEYFRFAPSLTPYYDRARVVVAHGGLGTAIEVLECGQKLIGVANPDRYDHHQDDLLHVLAERRHMIWCHSLDELEITLSRIDEYQFVPYERPECNIAQTIREYLDTISDKEGERLMSETTRLVYIMGRGYSGSTVLDAMLGNGKDTASVGELAGIVRPDRWCSCGTDFRDCEFWKQVRSEFEHRSGLNWEVGAPLVKNQAHITRFVGTLLALRDSSVVQELRTVNDALVEAISHVSGKRCVVDSSKELTRGLFLVRFLPDTKAIHLVRNPEGVLASTLDRIRDGTGFRFLRRTYHNRYLAFLFLALSIMNWVVANLLAEFIRLLAPSSVLRIRYEDLCADPKRELERLSSFTGCDLGSVIEAVEREQPIEVGHILGGSRMRMAGSFVFNPQAGSRRHLPWFYKVMVRVIAWPLMLFYGYKPFRKF